MIQDYSIYIQRCIQLAAQALGNTAPNPLVGCVIVHQDKIIGEGFHKKYGGFHAEVNAINAVKDKALLPKSSLFVNLEPCAHYGKTPPCADLIIQMQIPKVIIGHTDPYAEVCGKGIEKLKNAHIDVVTGVLANECRELNKRFLTYHEKKRPYIILKWAQTKDGFISPLNKEIGHPYWISSEFQRIYAHKLRTEEQAIMIGTNTALADNPRLTSRLWDGKNPLRIILDNKLRLPQNLHVFDDTVPTLVFTSDTNNHFPSLKLTEFVKINFNGSVEKQICNVLYEKGIQSVLVEGGHVLLQYFINAGLWDEAYVFKGDQEFKQGVKAPIISGEIYEDLNSGIDGLTIFKK